MIRVVGLVFAYLDVNVFYGSYIFLAATRDLTSPTPAVTCNGLDFNRRAHGDNSLNKESLEAKAFSVFNEDLLSLPVKQFIAESVQHFVIGLPSYSLTQLTLYFIMLLNSNFAKDIKDNKKINTTAEDLCKKVTSLGHCDYHTS